jgi:hypothetical protein
VLALALASVAAVLAPGGPDSDIWFSDRRTTSIGKIAPNGTITGRVYILRK